MTQTTITKSEKPYTWDDIIRVIAMFANSQGFYGRLLRDIYELQRTDPVAFEDYKQELVSQNFHQDLDVVFYFEC